MGIPQSASWAEMVGRKKSSKELRALWRKAIMEQILLIRMEKENKTLQGTQLYLGFFLCVSLLFLVRDTVDHCRNGNYSLTVWQLPTPPNISVARLLFYKLSTLQVMLKLYQIIPVFFFSESKCH